MAAARKSASARQLAKRVSKAWLAWNALMPGVRPDVAVRGLSAKARAAQLRWARANAAWFKGYSDALDAAHGAGHRRAR